MMPVVEALQVLIGARRPGQVVVTNQAAARIWPKLEQQALDFHYNPSTMGGAIPLALGLSLARPEREVLVVSGDGSLLMSLGSLVTVVGSGATNLTIVVLDNGMYEVTGGQKTAASGTGLDFAELARAAGFPSASQFSSLSDWKAGAANALSAAGPRFISLNVGATPREFLTYLTPALSQQMQALRQTLAG